MNLLVRDNSTKTDKFLYIVKSVRNVKTKKNTKKLVKHLGKLSELKLIYDDPIEHFKKVAKEMTEDSQKETLSESVNFNFSATFDNDKDNKVINMGCIFLSYLYHALEIDKVFKRYNERVKGSLAPINKTFMFLTYLRTLRPASKKANFEIKDESAEIFNFKLYDIYSSLSIFNLLKAEIVKTIYENLPKLVKLDTSICHYDLTNFYVYTSNYDDSDNNKSLLKRGYSKEHSQFPIVQMALLTDKNGIPLNYKLFPGNTNDVSSLDEFLKEQNRTFKIKRPIIVGDAGITSQHNIIETLKNKSGYIFKKSMFKLGKDEKEMFKKVVKPNIKKAIKLRQDLDKFYFSVTIDVDRTVNNINGKTIKIKLPQKYIFICSKKSKKRNEKINDEKIENALNIINSKSSYTKKFKKQTFNLVNIETYITDEDTGEILEVLLEKRLNEKEVEKIREVEGYSLLITSETEMSDEEIIKAYKNQYLIEESFKITKSDIESRPTYLSNDTHLESHFLTCFVALVYVRILQNLLNKEYSAKKIINALNEFNYANIGSNIYTVLNYDEIIIKLNEIFNAEVNKKNLKQANIRTLFKNSKKFKKKLK